MLADGGSTTDASNEQDGSREESCIPVEKPRSQHRSDQLSVLHGVRVLAAVVVVFHHIGALDEDLWDPAELRRNRKLSTDQRVDPFSYFIGVGPGHIAVEVFLVLAGLIVALKTWSAFDALKNSAQALERVYAVRLAKRFWRLALPVVPVHVVHWLLWNAGLAYGPYLAFPDPEDVQLAYSVGVRSVWASQLSGPLWILEALFLAPFVTLCVQVPALNMRTSAVRGVWYAFCVAYLIGNMEDVDTYSYQTGVVLGAAMADVLHHCELLGRVRCVLVPFLLLLFSLPWWPVPFYAQHISMLASGLAFVALPLLLPPRLRCLLGNRFFEGAAKYTYALYIWHVLILSIFAVNVHSKVSKPVLYVTAFGTCFLWPVAAYHCIEEPCLRLIDKAGRWAMS